jgi:uncharacterized protein DUF6879
MEPLSYEEFKALARASSRAFHLELKDTYHVVTEDEAFRRWQRGEPDDYAWHEEWLDFVRTAIAAGVQVQRVRVVSVPHTDYTRWGLEIARLNVQAGEVVRYLPRHLTADIDLPEDDYWLLDDDTLVLSVFSADGRIGSFVRERSPELLGQCLAARDQVWARAVPYARYVA